MIKDQGVKEIIPPESRTLTDSLISIDTISWYQTEEFTRLAHQCFDLRYFGCSGIESIHIIEGKFDAYINKHAGA